MKTWRVLPLNILLLVALVSPVWAKDTTNAVAAKHSAWKVQGEKCSVYLLGSVHVLKEEHYPLPAVFESAFSNASIVVFETDVGAMMKPESQLKLTMRAQLPEGQALKDVLTGETYASLARHLKENGMPEAMISRFKPGFVVVMLTMVELQKEGFDPASGMDLYFYKRTKPEGKTVRGLETLDLQMDLICNLSNAEGEALIKSTLADLKDAKTKFGELIKAWQTGDGAEIEKLLNQAQKEDAAIMKKFLTDRNLAWTPQIEELAKGTNNAVVIVGAGHLVGKDGIVELLKQKGCKVTQQ
jgi:uncharacterized protein